MSILPLKYIFQLILPYKKMMILILIHPFLKAISLIFPSYIIKNIIGLLSYTTTNEHFYTLKLTFGILLYFIVNNLFFGVSYIYQRYIYTYFYAYIRKDIINEGLRDLIYKPKVFFNMHPTSTIAHYLIHLHENSIDLVKLFIEKILPAITSFFIIIILIWYTNFACGIILSLWITVIIGLSYYILKNIDKYSINIIDEKVGITAYVTDVLNNIMTIKIFSKQEKEILFCKEKTEKLQKYEIVNNTYFAKIDLFYYISFTVMEILSCLILFIQYQKGFINLGDIVFWWTISGTTFAVAQSFISDVLSIPKYYYNIQEALLVVENKEIQKTNSTLCWKKGIIELCNVSFLYGDKKIIDSISYTFQSHKRIGIVGFSGSGKSSLIMLLLGIYKSTTGEIYIDGQNIQKINIDTWYEKCSVIFQDNNILNRSIIENITYNDELIINQDAYQLLIKELDLSFLDPHIDVKNLSGGEKQRINIGRALYKNSSEIFIFDEPTSNLDTITEDIIMNRINKIPNDKMIIMITHKLSLIQHFDEILVFDKGKIVEKGSHHSLLHEDGLYKKLWDLKEVN